MATRATVKAAAEALLPTRAQCGLLLLEGDLAPALLKALHTPQQHAALSLVSRTCALTLSLTLTLTLVTLTLTLTITLTLTLTLTLTR